MLHCKIANRNYLPVYENAMSKQLTISAAFSIFALAAFALFATAGEAVQLRSGVAAQHVQLAAPGFKLSLPDS